MAHTDELAEQRCLTQLAGVAPTVDGEVIARENVTALTSDLRQVMSGDVCIIRNPEGLGFATACN